MYKTVVDNTPLIKVNSAKHEANYSVNGSLMNPLEAFYAALAACAAVYAKKACKELGIPAAGIEIDCKPFSGPGGPLTLARFKSDVSFPELPSSFRSPRSDATVNRAFWPKKLKSRGHAPAFQFLRQEIRPRCLPASAAVRRSGTSL